MKYVMSILVLGISFKFIPIKLESNLFKRDGQLLGILSRAKDVFFFSRDLTMGVSKKF